MTPQGRGAIPPAKKREVRAWWDRHPYQYAVGEEDNPWLFFRNVDRKFLKWHPFAQEGFPILGGWIDYASLADRRVLDVGCGTGFATEQFSRFGARVTAFDITPRAALTTRRRLAFERISGDVLVADAEQMPFPDATFDYVLAWGCLQHSPDTAQGIREIHRVLRPGGRCGVMLYHRRSIHWYWRVYAVAGVLKLGFLRHGPAELGRRLTNAPEVGGSPLAQSFTRAGARRLFQDFREVRIRVDETPEVVAHLPFRALPLGRYLIPDWLKRAIVRRAGFLMWIDAVK